MRERSRTILAAAAIAALGLLPRTLEACSVCFGDPSSPQTKGASFAILFLLGVIGSVLAVLGVFFITLVRRARAVAAVRVSADGDLERAPATTGAGWTAGSGSSASP